MAPVEGSAQASTTDPGTKDGGHAIALLGADFYSSEDAFAGEVSAR